MRISVGTRSFTVASSRIGALLVRKAGEEPAAVARTFYELLARSTPGQRVELAFWRQGQAKTLRVTAQEIPGFSSE